MKTQILKINTIAEFEEWLNVRRPFMTKNEAANSDYMLNLVKTTKCKDCETIGLTVMLGEDSFNTLFYCNKCAMKWMEEMVKKRERAKGE